MALFNNCSNGAGPLHIQITQAKIDFQDENFKNIFVWNHKAWRLEPHGIEP